MSDSVRDDGYLEALEDGAGCTEIWETLSEHRETATGDHTDAE